MTSSSSSCVPDADLVASLTCSICLDLFDGPRMLPCGHTNCTRCLEELRRFGKCVIKCTLCQSLCTRPPALLPVNFVAKQLVELWKAKEEEKKRKEEEELKQNIEQKERMIEKMIRKFEEQEAEKWQKVEEEKEKRKEEEEEQRKKLGEEYQITICVVDKANWTSELFTIKGLKRWNLVADLKAKIAGRVGIPSWRQKLLYYRAELEDRNTLQTYNIVKHPMDYVYVYCI